MSDDFLPAIEMTPSNAKPTPAPEGGGDDINSPPVDSTGSIREARIISAKTREALRGIGKLAAQADTVVAVGEEAELEPMEHEPALGAAPAPTSPSRAAEVQARAAAAPPAQPAVPTPEAQPEPQQTAQSAAADIMARAEAEERRVAHELRMKGLDDKAKQLEEREKALAEREKQLPDRTALVERPAAVLSAYLKEVYGVSSDEELKEVLSDVVTDISENVLGIKMPDMVKTGLDSRRAVRTVKAYKAETERKERALREEREALDKAAQEKQAAIEHAQAEKQAIETVNRLVHSDDSKKTYPHLHAMSALGMIDNPANIVVAIIREQLKATGKHDWQAACRLAENNYKPHVEKALKEAEALRTRFNPSTAAPAQAVAAAKQAPVVSQVPGGQVPRPQTLTATPTAAPTPEPEPEHEDRYDRRHSSLRAKFRQHFPRQQQ